jgi:hypothetical protein
MRLILTLVLLTLATPALAANSSPPADGVLEINQVCAERKGCFAGDTAGYPITISTAGSYVLTSNLIIPDEYTHGIYVVANDVGIDLNNFAIIRSGCEGATLDCSPASGNGNGVISPSLEDGTVTFRGISVRNGSVVGMGDNGVRLREQSEVENLRARWNRGRGIQVGSGSTVSRSTAHENGDGIFASNSVVSESAANRNRISGIVAQEYSTVLGSTAAGNGSNGIFLFGTASGNTVNDNSGRGISAGQGSTVLGNAARRNGSYGIWAAGGSTVSGNSVYENGDDGILAGPGCTVSGNTVNSNAGDGLEVREGASVQNNTVRSNGGHGLNLLANDVTYRENTITNNSGGTVTGGLDMGANSCNGNVTCP